MRPTMAFKIFPATIHDNRKIPLLHNWQQLATTDPVQIKAWQDFFGDKIKLWGVPTGPANNIFVLDVDVKHENDNGFTTLQNENLTLPHTMTQTTMSGGRHYIYKYPNGGLQYGNRVKFKPGLDIRGEGGWIAYYGPDDTPMADAPEWVVKEAVRVVADPTQAKIAVAPEIAQGIFETALDNIREAPEGESNDVLNTESFKIGQLVASNSINKDYAEKELFKAAKDRGKPDYEAIATIRSGLDGGGKKPLTCPFGEDAPVASFPIPAPPKPRERWTPERFSRSDLLNMSNLKKPQLFKDWSTEDIHLTTADGGTGKTTLKLFEAICLALGESFIGFECKQRGKTLFITGEDTQKKLGAMIGAILRQMGLLDNAPENNAKVEIVLDSIIVKKDSDMCLISKDRQGFLQYNTDALKQLLEGVQDLQPKMIVFDPISSFWGSEAALNDMAKAVSKFMAELAEQSGACIEMINHMGKSSSTSKDMSQFAGRGGTGLPSHSRVSRVLRPVYEDEYKDLTGEDLVDGESAIMCNVNKFSDGSPLYNKPFLIVRSGYIFARKNLTPEKAREKEKELSDCERVFTFIKEARSNDQYPTKAVATSYFMSNAEPLSQAAVKRALDWLMFSGIRGERLKMIDNPDMSIPDKAYVIQDMTGKEV